MRRGHFDQSTFSARSEPWCRYDTCPITRTYLALTHKNDVDSSAVTSQHFEDLLKEALTSLPLQLQQQAAGVVTVIMCDPPPHAPKESLVAIVQAPTHLRLEVYKNNFDEGTKEEVLEKLKSVLADEFSFYFDS